MAGEAQNDRIRERKQNLANKQSKESYEYLLKNVEFKPLSEILNLKDSEVEDSLIIVKDINSDFFDNIIDTNDTYAFLDNGYILTKFGKGHVREGEIQHNHNNLKPTNLHHNNTSNIHTMCAIDEYAMIFRSWV